MGIVWAAGTWVIWLSIIDLAGLTRVKNVPHKTDGALGDFAG